MQNFADFYVQKQNLQEMPWVSTDKIAYDFEMEKPGWDKKLIQAVQEYKDTEQLLSPFYKLFGLMFKKKYNELPEENKEALRQVLPPQFLKDMEV